MWHVRERIFPSDVTNIGYDAEARLIVEHATENRADEQLPENFDSITYAYSLSTSRGFVEFRAGDKVVKRLDDRWIAVENLTHNTTGTYPNIRLKARKEDIKNIIATNTCVVIQGKTPP